MSSVEMIMVRVYLSEESAHLEQLMTLLHDVDKVKGVTVFRGIEGYGDSGHVHTSNIVGLSLNLPVVVEFFDESEKIMKIIKHLEVNIKPGHIVYWPVKVRT